MVKKQNYISLLVAALLTIVFTTSAGTTDVRPHVGFIESLTPFCYQPNPAQGECYLNWVSMHVEAAPASMQVMTVTLDAIGPVARYQGYFNGTLYCPPFQP